MRSDPIPLIAFLSTAAFSSAASPVRADEWNDMNGCVGRAGDVDRDGISDLLVSNACLETPEVVWVVSGRGGSLLLSLHGKAPGDGFGCAFDAAGDVDRDGYVDFIVGARGGRTVKLSEGAYGFEGVGLAYAQVRSGQDGRVLHEFSSKWKDEQLGESVAGAGDVNGDGHPDVIVGSPSGHGGRPGFARIYSGKDGSVLLQLNGECTPPSAVRSLGDPDCPRGFGTSVTGCGDLDGDGHADVAVGDIGRSTGVLVPGGVQAFSGKSGKVLFTAWGNDEENWFGWSLTSAGDVNRDGVPDLLVGELHWCASVLSGRDGAVIHEWSSRGRKAHSDAFGSSIDALGDIDGDGYPELIVSANESLIEAFDEGYARVYSGKDGSTLTTLALGREGVEACGLGDIDADHVPDFVLCLPARGLVRFVSGASFKTIREIDWKTLHEIERARAEKPK